MYWYFLLPSLISSTINLLISPVLYIFHYIFSLTTVCPRGKRVLVTGCSSGFGLDLVKSLARQSVTVYAACLSQALVDELADLDLDGVIPVKMDVTDQKDVEQVRRRIEAETNGEGLWAVVNNAGVNNTVGPVDWLSPADYEDVMKTNFFGAVNATTAFLPLLHKSKGRLVFCVSSFSHIPSKHVSPYAASKGALNTFARCIRLDLEGSGVKVITVTPGFFFTNLVAGMEEQIQKIAPAVSVTGPTPEEIKTKSAMNMRYMAGNNSITEVTTAYERALFSKRPRHNYWAGNETMLIKLIKIFPEFLALNSFRRQDVIVETVHKLGLL